MKVIKMILSDDEIQNICDCIFNVFSIDCCYFWFLGIKCQNSCDILLLIYFLQC